MELDLSPKTAQTYFEGDGGAYYIWSSSDFGKVNVGAGKLVLQPQGFALPHFGDSSKVGYVLQGNGGVAGVVLNNKEEMVVELKKGDVIVVPLGAISWWFNNGDSELIIVFLGDTSKAQTPGQFSYMLLAGALGVLGGFSSDLIGRSYKLNNDETSKLTQSQKGVLIIKLDKGTNMPVPCKEDTKKLVYNIDANLESGKDCFVDKGGLVTTLTEREFSFIGEAGLSAVKTTLEAKAIRTPMYSADSVSQLIYIAKGSGRVEIVGMEGKGVLDTQVKEGHLLLVPKFLVVAKVAGEEGMECFSILTTPKPPIVELAGKTSVLGALSPAIKQVAFNVDEEFEELLSLNIRNTSNVTSPKK